MTIQGEVVKGKQRGRTLGFPTLNIKVDKHIPSGVYISKTTIDDVKYPSVTFIGNPETFHEQSYKSETYILQFSQTVYGKKVSINLVKKIRESIKFQSANELIKQIEKDVKCAQDFFSSLSV